MYLTNNNQIGLPMHRRTNTTIEEVNKSIEELSLQWNVSEKDNLKIATCIIGLQLRKIRLMRGRTQSRVAKAVNVTFQQIQKYERGQNAISINIMMKLCEYLDVSVDFFIKPLEDKQLTFLKRRENVYQIKQDFVAR